MNNYITEHLNEATKIQLFNRFNLNPTQWDYNGQLISNNKNYCYYFSKYEIIHNVKKNRNEKKIVENVIFINQLNGFFTRVDSSGTKSVI